MLLEADSATGRFSCGLDSDFKRYRLNRDGVLLCLRKLTLLDVVTFCGCVEVNDFKAVRKKKSRNDEKPSAEKSRLLRIEQNRIEQNRIEGSSEQPDPGSGPLPLSPEIQPLSFEFAELALRDPIVHQFLIRAEIKISSYTLWVETYEDQEWVDLEIKKALAWLDANPRKAPKKNFARFVTSWLSRGWESHRKSIPSRKAWEAESRILTREELEQ
jgi:hypothetical protein